MPHTHFLMIGFFAVTCLTLSAPHAPAEEPWTNLGFDTDGWFTGSVTEAPSGTLYVRARFFDNGQFSPSGIFRMQPGETEWTQILDTEEIEGGIGDYFVPTPDTILIRSRNDIYRSLDGGDTWDVVYHDENFITTMIQLRTGEFIAPCLDHYVVSSDLGDTWTSHPITATDEALEIAFDGPDRIYVIDEYHIYRSDDGGSSWQVIYEVFDIEAGVGNMIIDSEGTIYCDYSSAFTGASYLMASIDHGDTWSYLLSNQIGNYALASTGEIFAFKWGIHNIYRSTDQGQTWVTDFGLDAPYLNDPSFYGIVRLYIGPSDTLYVTTNVGLYRYEIKVPVELSVFGIE